MRTKRKYFVLAAIIALLLHGLLLFLLMKSKTVPDLANLAQPPPIQVHLKKQEPKKQIVDTPPPLIEKTPKKADYFSEFDHQVQKETEAARKNATPTPPTKPKRPATPQHPPLNSGHTLKNTLLPTWQELAEANPPSSFNDHLDSKTIGAQTELNTFEWKHAAYFNRIKQSVSRTWSPLLQIKRYDPGAALIGQQDRLTVVEITIDTTGKVTDAQIKNSSHVFYLDDEAIAAFKRASPFPYPPQALFESEPDFTFTFGFYVNVQKGFSINFD